MERRKIHFGKKTSTFPSRFWCDRYVQTHVNTGAAACWGLRVVDKGAMRAHVEDVEMPCVEFQSTLNRSHTPRG